MTIIQKPLPQFLVIPDQGSLNKIIGQNISDEKPAFIPEIQKRQQGGRNVDLAGDFIDLTGCDVFRRIYQKRNVVFFDGQPDFPSAVGAMVGHQNKHRSVKPGMGLGLGHQLPQGVVRVFQSPGAARTGMDVYFPFGIGIRPVVAGGHDVGEKRFSCFIRSVSRLNRLAVQIFVAHAPGVFECLLIIFEIRLIDNIVTVAGKKTFLLSKNPMPPYRNDTSYPLS